MGSIPRKRIVIFYALKVSGIFYVYHKTCFFSQYVVLENCEGSNVQIFLKPLILG